MVILWPISTPLQLRLSPLLSNRKAAWLWGGVRAGQNMARLGSFLKAGLPSLGLHGPSAWLAGASRLGGEARFLVWPWG